MPTKYNIYEFGDFRLDEEEEQLYKKGEKIQLDAKAVQILLMLVKRVGKAVTRDEMMQQVWKNSFIEDNGIDNRLSAIRTALGIKKWTLSKPKRGQVRIQWEKKETGDNVPDQSFDIKKVTGQKAYRFIGKVKKSRKEFAPESSEEIPGFGKTGEPFIPSADPNRSAAEELDDLSGGNESDYSAGSLLTAVVSLAVALVYFERGWYYGSSVIETRGQIIFIIAACFSFAALNAVGLILEAAYQFERYGRKPVRMIPVVILLNLGAMFYALTYALSEIRIGLNSAFGWGFTVLLSAALLSCGIAYFVLPNKPIAIATFQTQPALIAFCKNALIYFLPVFSGFGLLVFCLINSNADYSSNPVISAVLLIILLIIVFNSYYSTNYLSDRLLPEKNGIKYPHKSLYSSLLLWRAVFCFLPSLAFVFWYLLQSLEKYFAR